MLFLLFLLNHCVAASIGKDGFPVKLFDCASTTIRFMMPKQKKHKKHSLRCL
jgi:hypothetical protein